MRRHHASQPRAQPVVGLRVFGQDCRERAVVHRARHVRVGHRVAVGREVLAAVGHAGAHQAEHQALGEHRHHPRIAVEGAVADHLAALVVEVDHRRVAQIDAAGAKLGAEHIAGRQARVDGAHRVLHPQLAELSHRREVGETVGAKALHPAALVVDGDQQIGPQRLHLGSHLGQLAPVLPVAGEEDQPAGERVLDAAAIVVVQAEAGDVEDDGSVRVHGVFVSTTTKAAA